MDETLRVIAFDRGAEAILQFGNQPEGTSDGKYCMPADLVEAIEASARTGVLHPKLRLPTKHGEYLCRTYIVETADGLLRNQSLVALHLEKAPATDSAIREVSAKYHLSEREQETLKGVMTGLSTKEMADLMNISPHTVKAYIRLITIKLGATSRWGIISKVIENREALEEEP